MEMMCIYFFFLFKPFQSIKYCMHSKNFGYLKIKLIFNCEHREMTSLDGTIFCFLTKKLKIKNYHNCVILCLHYFVSNFLASFLTRFGFIVYQYISYIYSYLLRDILWYQSSTCLHKNHTRLCPWVHVLRLYIHYLLVGHCLNSQNR